MQYTKAWLRYEGNKDNLNCKTQEHARVCEETKLEEKMTPNWNNSVVKGASFKDCVGRVEGTYQDDILKDDSPKI